MGLLHYALTLSDFVAQIGKPAPGVDHGSDAQAKCERDQFIDLPKCVAADPIREAIERIDSDEDNVKVGLLAQ
jgi:hypothetical protein